GVSEVAVFGVPDEEWGEAVKAAAVLAPGAAVTEAEIIAFCKAHLDAYKAPKSVDFLPALPHTGSGKILKKALRDPYWTGRERKGGVAGRWGRGPRVNRATLRLHRARLPGHLHPPRGVRSGPPRRGA